VPSLVIRKVTPVDLPSVQGILREVELGEEGLERHFRDFLVVEVDDTIVGTIGLELYDTQGLLRSAAVLPAYQGRGIGGKLMAAVRRYAIERGAKELTLLTTTAATYFEQKGFARIRRESVTGDILKSEQFQGACPATAVVMRMEL